MASKPKLPRPVRSVDEATETTREQFLAWVGARTVFKLVGIIRANAHWEIDALNVVDVDAKVYPSSYFQLHMERRGDSFRVRFGEGKYYLAAAEAFEASGVLFIPPPVLAQMRASAEKGIVKSDLPVNSRADLETLPANVLDRSAPAGDRFVFAGVLNLQTGAVHSIRMFRPDGRKLIHTYFQIGVKRKIGGGLRMVSGRGGNVCEAAESLERGGAIEIPPPVKRRLKEKARRGPRSADSVRSRSELEGVSRERILGWCGDRRLTVLTGALIPPGKTDIMAWETCAPGDDNVPTSYFKVIIRREGDVIEVFAVAGSYPEDIVASLEKSGHVSMRDEIKRQLALARSFVRNPLREIGAFGEISHERLSSWAGGRSHFILAGRMNQKTGAINRLRAFAPGEIVLGHSEFQVELIEDGPGHYRIGGATKGQNSFSMSRALARSGAVRLPQDVLKHLEIIKARHSHRRGA